MFNFISLPEINIYKNSVHVRMSKQMIWTSDGSYIEINRTCMVKYRFKFLVRNIQFKDKYTRMDRMKIDKLAPIRFLYNIYDNNCKKLYSVSEYVVIDEKLGFHA